MNKGCCVSRLGKITHCSISYSNEVKHFYIRKPIIQKTIIDYAAQLRLHAPILLCRLGVGVPAEDAPVSV